MFVDKVEINIRAGKGGNGVVSFRHEKFVDRGGPDGGDGGDGGNIVVVGSTRQNTLASYRYQKELVADDGSAGSKRKKHGKTASDLLMPVPVGTVVSNDKGELIADIIEDGQKIIVAHGGKGGFGNAHFVSSRRQAPKVAEKGEPGETYQTTLELKMIAEIGLVGLPNAGKSTLLSRISNAKPEIADYPFTTLRPNLGVADLGKNRALLVADIPGLIEGASEGKGLGDEFLRHVERTRVLIHLIDGYSEDLEKSYQIIKKELGAYKIDLRSKPEIVVINKIDGLDEDIVNDSLSKLRRAVGSKTSILAISAVSGQGVQELLSQAAKLADKEAKKEAPELDAVEIPTIRLDNTDPAWTIVKRAGVFVVEGVNIERFAKRTDFDNQPGIDRLREIMRKMGIMHDLERRKVNPGDIIQFGEVSIGRFEY